MNLYINVDLDALRRTVRYHMLKRRNERTLVSRRKTQGYNPNRKKK